MHFLTFGTLTHPNITFRVDHFSYKVIMKNVTILLIKINTKETHIKNELMMK